MARFWDATRFWGWICGACAKARGDKVFVGMRYTYFVGGSWIPKWR